MISTERNSSIEIVTSVVLEDRFTLLCLSNGGRIAVNLFVLISCYFMVDKKQHIGTRWLRTYIPLFFYSATITTILLFMGFLDGIASAIEIFRCYFPFFGRPLWFEILNVNAWRGGPNTLLLGIVLTIILYLALAGIEYIRRLIIDSWLFKTKLFNATADLIDKFTWNQINEKTY